MFPLRFQLKIYRNQIDSNRTFEFESGKKRPEVLSEGIFLRILHIFTSLPIKNAQKSEEPVCHTFLNPGRFFKFPVSPAMKFM